MVVVGICKYFDHGRFARGNKNAKVVTLNFCLFVLHLDATSLSTTILGHTKLHIIK